MISSKSEKKFEYSSSSINSQNGTCSPARNEIVMGPEKLYYSDENEVNNEYFMKDGRYEKAKGLHWFVTGLFVVGDLAGGGLVAMPTAMIRFGFGVGVFFIVLITLITTYTSHLLGRNWLIMQRRWPSAYASGHCRKPYPEMAQRSVGTNLRRIVSICINITQFGIAVVYLLLSARNIHNLLNSFFSINISFCGIVLIVALALLPVTFLKSPQDFWGVVVLGMFTTAFAVILISIGTLLDYSTCAPVVKEVKFMASNYFLALGTFIFSYGGHAVFPTIQHDMRRPFEFTKSSILAFGIVTSMYTPVCILGYLTYGDALRDSIIESLQAREIQQAVNILITIHCILTLTIVFNPMNQEAEEYFNVPHYFGIKRILVRMGMMCAVVFVAESLPNFEPLLDLVGGSTLTLTSLVFPTVFYLMLSTGEEISEEQRTSSAFSGKRSPSFVLENFAGGSKQEIVDYEDEVRPTFGEIVRRTNKTTLFICGFVIAFAILGGSAATFSAIKELSIAKFVPPCYVSVFLPTGPDDGLEKPTGLNACCGPHQNISRFAHTPAEINKFCAPPDHSRYV